MKKSTVVLSLQLLLFGFLVVLSGCGDGKGANPSTVSGKIMYKDQPVAGAIVTFRAADNTTSFFAKSDESGVYTLRDSAGVDGAVPGDYVVTVAKREVLGGSNVSEDDPNYDGGSGAEAEIKDLLPVKYSQQRTSDLKVTVVEGPNDIPLNLVD